MEKAGEADTILDDPDTFFQNTNSAKGHDCGNWIVANAKVLPIAFQFKPLLGETGKPVVRAITEADIDALGEAVMDTILFG